MNKVILIGNLTRDPELSETNSGIAVCRFGLAVNRQYSSSDGERETDFFQVTAWRGTGENVARYCIDIQAPKWAQKEAFRFKLRPKEKIIFFNDYYYLSLSKDELRKRAMEYVEEWHKEACERLDKTQKLLRRYSK